MSDNIRVIHSFTSNMMCDHYKTAKKNETLVFDGHDSMQLQDQGRVSSCFA
jgi:hypothetical protein